MSPATFIHELFEHQALKTPEAIAVEYLGLQLSYRELNERSNQLAHHLAHLGVGSETLVAICVERSIEMMVGLLGILKAGAAYVPLDPEYPSDRIQFMLWDSQAGILLTQAELLKKFPDFSGRLIEVDSLLEVIASQAKDNPCPVLSSQNAAYVMYTSGSTGVPKGVVVSHGNLANYFSSMNKTFGHRTPGQWVAVTSICFDISVMELFWTLTQGDRVIIHPGFLTQASQRQSPNGKMRALEFSLFFFSAEHQDNRERYRLLLEAARFGDNNGFCAVWTPERHFHPFGGIYPNPAVTSAAIAAATTKIGIRAGSVVAPLHDPLRVAEEWSVVDNLSDGRVSISFASGWHANDFVLAPEHFQDRKQIMLRQIETIRSLWRGEPVSRKNGAGRQVQVTIYPPPLQKELPIWVTAAGSPETFRLAGDLGAGLLTHLLGQDLEALAGKIALYRNAYRAAGHDGNGHVALMLHTYVGEDPDRTRSLVREPFCKYLQQSLDLMHGLFAQMGVHADASKLNQSELEPLLLRAFERYCDSGSLVGDQANCWKMLNQLSQIDVDEIACLIDFGVDTDEVLASLSRLNSLKDKWNRAANSAKKLDWVNTDVQCTPTFAMAMRDEWKSSSSKVPVLRRLLVGGEALSENLARNLLDVTQDGLYNMYGPTETTIWSAMHRVTLDHGSVPLGKPIDNTQIYVLDKHLRPVAVGVTGEGYIGGAGLARGYLNRPELTAERFIPNPFSKQPGQRLYRTGDLLKWRSDGNLEFVGRTDQQVKLRGFRIELGEIESSLGRHPSVAQALAAVHRDQFGDDRLIAYIVPKTGHDLVLGELRALLREKLPAYMQPSHFVTLPEFPLTSNGKIDRRLLPIPNPANMDERYIAPANPVQKSLAQIWARVLKVERVGIEDDFFHLGGHSLLLMQVLAQVNAEFGVEIPLRTFFERPTVAALAEIIGSGSKPPLPTIMPVPRTGSLPLSREEETLWLLAQISPTYEGLHVPMAWRIRGKLDIGALAKSLNRIVERHENLRTTFATAKMGKRLLRELIRIARSTSSETSSNARWIERRTLKLGSRIRRTRAFIFAENRLMRLVWAIIGQPFRVITGPAEVPLTRSDLQHLGEADRENEAKFLVKEEVYRAFDLDHGPWLRTKLIQLAPEDQIFIVTMHHLVSDGWSLAVFFRELRICYEAYRGGTSPLLPDLSVQYADYAAWRRSRVEGEVFNSLVDYWKERLSGLPPVLPLPTDASRPVAPSLPSATVFFTIPPQETKELKQLSQRHGSTLFLVLLTIFQLLLYRLSGLDDIAVAITVAERSLSELHLLIGLFLGFVVVRTDLSGHPPFTDLLQRVSKVALEAYEHQESAAIAEALMREVGVQEYARLRGSTFKAYFTWVNVPRMEPPFSDLKTEPFAIPERAAEIGPDIVLQGGERGDAIEFRVIYKEPLFSTDRMVEFTNQFIALVRQVIDAPGRTITDYTLEAYSSVNSESGAVVAVAS